MKSKYKEVGWVNLHCHGEFSLFDGFGKMKHRAEHAKELGQTALGISEHGTVSGLVEHYQACINNNIKPILGCEIYFKYKFDLNNEQDKKEKYFHMCLFCKDLKGYQNLMSVITDANRDSFYRVPIVTYAMLKKYHEGLICSTACIAGWPSQAIMQGNDNLAAKRILKLKELFKDDLYIELMPYHVYDEVDGKEIDLQYEIDIKLMKIAEEVGVKCIITTDSHFIRKEDYETFQMIFKIGKKNFDIDYSQRYMPSEKDVARRFKTMYGKDPRPYLINTKELSDKCNCKLEFEEGIPKLEWPKESKEYLKDLVKAGLKEKKRWTEKHWRMCLNEFDVIFDLGFEDYFLLCWDIVKYALDNNIGYGKGRGSVCGSLVAYALNITDVDPIELGTKFERFLRKDKKKMPKQILGM